MKISETRHSLNWTLILCFSKTLCSSYLQSTVKLNSYPFPNLSQLGFNNGRSRSKRTNFRSIQHPTHLTDSSEFSEEKSNRTEIRFEFLDCSHFLCAKIGLIDHWNLWQRNREKEKNSFNPC